MNTTLSIEHINQPVEITYYETEGHGPFRRVGTLQGFYDTGKGVQFWMVGRSSKQYVTDYTVRTLPPAEAEKRSPQRIPGVNPASRTRCERLTPEHLNRVIEIEYTTAPGKPTRRMAGRLTGYDETNVGLEWWIQGRTASRHATTYTIHHYPTAPQTIGADQ